ncbi:tape measure domain-containing protein, partial [Buttiauxella sp. BIGb0471]|uniref:tape measure protein n=1 Tax=Buttiauxella sp. BIGb0471 TaxID=2940597 RepID=UPI00216A9233
MNIRELLIKIGVDTGDAVPELNKVDRAVDATKRSFQALNGVLTALFAGGAIKGILSTADAMQDLQSRIGSATGDLSGANAQLNDLAKHANDNRMSVDAYADSWAKFETGMVRMGKTSDDTTDLVDGLSAAFRVNGTAAATSQGALFQLTQSISGGTVQMEELNSLMDAQGNLYVSVAEDIGGTTTAFKKMVSQGKVTSKMLAESLIKNTRKYITQLREMPRTLGDVWTVVSNDVKMAINNVNDATKGIPRAAKALMRIWTSLKTTVGDLV